MKGLLRKDFYVALSTCRTLLLVSGVFMVVSIFGSSNLFFTVFPGMYLSIIGISLYSQDETQGWLEYSQTLPLGRDIIVTERYLFTLLLSVVGFGFFLVCQLICMVITPGFTLSSLLGVLPLYLVSSLAAPIFNLPCMFRWGAEKGRLVYVATIALMGGFYVPVGVFSNPSDGLTLPAFSMALTLPLLLVLYWLSWRLSLRFFRQRAL